MQAGTADVASQDGLAASARKLMSICAAARAAMLPARMADRPCLPTLDALKFLQLLGSRLLFSPVTRNNGATFVPNCCARVFGSTAVAGCIILLCHIGCNQLAMRKQHSFLLPASVAMR
jgi:hypothetical protein